MGCSDGGGGGGLLGIAHHQKYTQMHLLWTLSQLGICVYFCTASSGSIKGWVLDFKVLVLILFSMLGPLLPLKSPQLLAVIPPTPTPSMFSWVSLQVFANSSYRLAGFHYFKRSIYPQI